MTKQARALYEKGNLQGPYNSYEKLLKSALNDAQFVEKLAQDAELLEAVLPVYEAKDISSRNTLSVLWRDCDVGLRYHTIAVILLHHLGLDLSDPVQGTFRPTENSKYSLERDILGTDNAECNKARSLLHKLITSMAWCGLMHYALQIYNHLMVVYFMGKAQNRQINLWLKSVRVTMATVLRIICPPDSEFSPNNRAAYFANLTRPEDAETEPLITEAVPVRRTQPTRTCKHGIFKCMVILEGQKQMVCPLFGHSEDCGERENI